ncbi:DUF742 domain-containing protein [Streptomyces sp. DSM 44915]|uniref:DUF742 domain-containing protein n=1 Tax=Streptomyces chisholmiae TaxID=3075540 RepID=A0ABU2JVD4_9ACTN|nr:DUF742 domain-containing protein [Streptomyces sp. DSM 44915]MDT0268193.1 DUF742 domain-containing protein [Streptomyces sp. DSM 44915]
MSRPGRDEEPDRLYIVTRGRSRASSDAFDLVTLVVSESEPTSGMQSEHTRILKMCQYPTAVVEVAAELRLPITVVRILLSDLLDSGLITARHPKTASSATHLPHSNLLEQVLVGLRNL